MSVPLIPTTATNVPPVLTHLVALHVCARTDLKEMELCVKVSTTYLSISKEQLNKKLKIRQIYILQRNK